MSNFPGSLFSQTDPTGNDYVSASGTVPGGTYLDHGQQHKNLNDEIAGLELWLGTNSASSGVFANYTAGQTPLPINNGTLGTVIIGGTFNNLTFGSAILQAPTINGLGTNSGTIKNGIYTNGTFGTSFIQGGTANNQTLGTPTVQGAVINTANIIGSAVTNPMGTSATGLSQTGTTHDPTTTLITGGSFQMITTGNPVLLLANVSAAKNTNTGYMIVYLETNGTLGQYGNVGPGIANANYSIPIMSLVTLAAGTYTFALGGAVDAGTVTFNSYSLVAIELKR